MKTHKAILLLDKKENQANNKDQVAKPRGNLGIHTYGTRPKWANVTHGRLTIGRLAVGRLAVRWLLSIPTLLIPLLLISLLLISTLLIPARLLIIWLTANRRTRLWWGIASILVRPVGVLPLVRIPAHAYIDLSS